MMSADGARRKNVGSERKVNALDKKQYEVRTSKITSIEARVRWFIAKTGSWLEAWLFSSQLK